jgi:hypothetical protein
LTATRRGDDIVVTQLQEVTDMGKIGWGTIYAAEAAVAAPAVAATAVLAAAYWVEDKLREARHTPAPWEVRYPDDARLERQLATITANLARRRA